MSRPVLREGATGADVETLQRYLRWFRYETGAISGRLDAATADAVRRYQRDHGLPVTGVVDGDVWDSLEHGTDGAARPRIVTGESIVLDGSTLRYVARNVGGRPAAGTCDDLEIRSSTGAGSADGELVAHGVFRVGVVPPDSSYVGHFDLGHLPSGTYRMVIRLDAPAHDESPAMPGADQRIERFIHVAEHGGAPQLLQP